MDATLFLVSAQYVSAGRFRDLADKLEAASDGLSRVIRLEAEGQGLWSALDDLTRFGARRIDLRPIGLPFSQSLERWLPGAAGSWLARQDGPRREIFVAAAPQDDAGVVAAAVRARVPMRAVAPSPGGHLGKGWDAPPDARHHLLVCTGPRCHLQDAPALVDLLKHEIGRAGLTEACLLTTTGCLFPCNKGPSLVHYPAGNWYRIPDAAALRRFVAEALVAGRVPTELCFYKTGQSHELV